MIKTKEDLYAYLEETRKAYGKPVLTFKERIKSLIFPDSNYEYMRCLRKLEYHTNNRDGFYHKVMTYLYNIKMSKLRYRTGIELNVNCAGCGLHVSHGKVVISSIAKIGENCKILSDVTIGGTGRYNDKITTSHEGGGGAPVIGNRVFIGSGAKILGGISIADDCVIGANSVVVKSIMEKGITVAGIPAKKISDKGSYHYLNRT